MCSALDLAAAGQGSPSPLHPLASWWGAQRQLPHFMSFQYSTALTDHVSGLGEALLFF